jgi:hypothetical protein
MHLDFNRERLQDIAEDCCNKRNEERRGEMILVTSELVVQMVVNDCTSSSLIFFRSRQSVA